MSESVRVQQGIRVGAYNWSNISDHDFEMICRDVMSSMLGVRVEAFTAGRDGGLDLRAAGTTPEIWGQAKHYLRSSFGKLEGAAKKEKSRLDSLTPKLGRYLFFTSQALTPARKATLRGALSPYCVADSDILGIEDIEGILAQNPDIERHHFKLWLSSVSVLERIIGSSVATRSRARVDELTQRARLFVPHDSMNRAQEILRAEKSLIISGPPGIGKTTLAEMLCLRFLTAAYDVHFVSTVSELESVIRDDAKQLFVFDDFLGRTNLREAPPASDQERLFTMIRHLRQSANKYLILTTREYLYKEARAANERLTANRSDLLKCLLDVEGYSKMNRAAILYNHLYWAASIPRDDLREFVTRKGYVRVIDHPNFNPRFIADTINRLWPADMDPSTTDEAGLWT